VGATGLRVNAAAASGGQLELELQPASPTASGLSVSAIPVTANGVDLAVVWQGNTSVVQAALGRLDSLEGQDVQLRFSLRDAELYFWWIDTQP
jgi:hypothetical protein